MVVAITYIVLMSNSIRLKDLNSNDLPRERLIQKGPEALSDSELLALIIKSGGRDLSAVDLSLSLLKKYKNLQTTFSCDFEQLKKHKYIGSTKAITISAINEISKRIHLTHVRELTAINKPRDVFNFIKKDIFNKKQEYLYLISLDSRKKIIAKNLVCIGSVNETLIPTREIFIKALSKNAVFIILVHNHPSNDPSPSNEDLTVTQKIADAGKIIGIKLIDHIVVTNSDYTSLKNMNCIN